MSTRTDNLISVFIENSVDATLISSPHNILYLTNFSHFSPTEREAYLLITKNSQYIFTDGRYTEAVKKHITKMSLQGHSKQRKAIPNKKGFQLIEISSQNSFENLLKDIVEKEKILSLGIEANNITVTEHKKIARLVKNIKHLDLTQLRTQKDKEEIAAIKQACIIGDMTFTYILSKIKPGITEKELAFEMESFIRKNDAEISFKIVVAFGKNSAFPHHKTGNERLKNKDAILLDFGVKYENYCSDMTRTIFLGKASADEKRIYSTVLTAQQKAIYQLNNSIMRHFTETSPLEREQSAIIKTKEIDNIARSYILSQGFNTIPHSLGHGIGLDVHEAPSLSPKSKETLKSKMVFSIEPGIYLTDFIGVRIEDLFAIQGNKAIQLTRSPKNLIEL